MPLHATSSGVSHREHATSSGGCHFKWRIPLQVACLTVSMPLHATSSGVKWREVAKSVYAPPACSMCFNLKFYLVLRSGELQVAFELAIVPSPSELASSQACQTNHRGGKKRRWVQADIKCKCQIILTEAQVTTWDTYKLRPSLEWHSQCPRIGLARSWCNDAAQMFSTPSTNSTALRDGNVPLSPLSPIWGIIANKHIIIFGWCLFSPKKDWTWTTPWIKAAVAFGKFSRYTSHVVACEELHKIASTRLVFSEDLKDASSWDPL